MKKGNFELLLIYCLDKPRIQNGGFLQWTGLGFAAKRVSFVADFLKGFEFESDFLIDSHI